MESNAGIELVRRSVSHLGQASRAYLEFWWSFEGRWGEVIESSSEEKEVRWPLCTACHFLLERWLKRLDGWPDHGWVDGFYPDRINVVGRHALEMPGTFLWVEGQESWWLEPGFVSVQRGCAGFETYTLKFGDAVTGLSTQPWHSPRRAHVWTAPKEWLFEFEGHLHTALH